MEALFGRYLEQRLADDASTDPEALCRDSPDLLEPLRELIREYEKVDEMLAPPGELPPGRTLLHYRILRKIGAGGMGHVYVAEDTKLGRRVAVKVLPPGMRRKRERLERFRREARIVAALNHPNIVTLYSVEESEDICFITMELVEGKTLARLLPRDGLPPESLLKWALPLTDALSAAHERGITHRDIKPANVMVNDDGLVKVLDFGLAKLPRLESAPACDDVATRTLLDEDVSHLTRTGLLLGTVPYMSPEQVRGELLGPRSDVFSLGVFLYEMCTGRRPFRGASPAEVISAVLREEPEALSELRPSLPPDLVRITERCLAKDPHQRYPTARELHDALAALGQQIQSGDAAPPAAVRPVKRQTVGREKELEELRRGLAAASGEHGLLLCVAGEPGIGKTTLVEDYLAEIASTGPPCTVARGRCSERLAGTEAYLPFLDVLEDLLKSRTDGSVVGLMRRAAPWWYAQVASLSADDPLDVRLLEDIRNTTQEKMKREMATFLEELSQKRPVVLFFDDLHWSDVSTIDLLAYLAGRFDALRVLTVATYRPEELSMTGHPFLEIRPDLLTRGLCREIEVGFLSPGDITDYLALGFPGHAFPPELAVFIYGKTEGSPLFMSDLVRFLRDRHVIVEEDGRWAVSQTVSEIRLGLPGSVHSMIQRKLDHLSDEDRRLLTAAGVQGYEFDSEVVAQVLQADPEEVEERLQALDHDHGFVRYLEDREFPDLTLTLRYRFVHVLYQNELYASLPRTKLARLSRAVAEALLGHYGEECASQATEIAVLLESARDFVPATRFFGLAALQALQDFAYQESILLSNRGLALLRPLPETPETARQELELLGALAPALMLTRGYGDPEVAQAYTRAWDLCRRVERSPQLGPVLWGLSMYYGCVAQNRKGCEVGERLLRLARREKDTAMLIAAHHILGANLYWLGEPAQARPHLEQAQDLYDPQKHRSLTFVIGHHSGVEIGADLAWTLWFLGYADQARETVRKALRLAEDYSSPFSLNHNLGWSSFIHQFRRDPQATRETSAATIAIASEHGFLVWWVGARIMESWAKVEQDQIEIGEAISQMEEDLKAFRMVMKLFVPYFLSLTAEVYAKSGRSDKALALLNEALEMEEHDPFWQAELHRQKGEMILLESEDEPEAESCFHQALEIARGQQAKFLELRAVMSLSRLWRMQGKGDQAHELLAGTYGWFTEGFDTADLREAKTLLGELMP